MLGGVNHNLGAPLRLGGHADNVELFAGDHFAIIGILCCGRHVVAAAKLGHHLGAHIGAGHQLGAWTGDKAVGMGHRQHNRWIADHLVVNKATHPATANDRGAVRFHASSSFVI